MYRQEQHQNIRSISSPRFELWPPEHEAGINCKGMWRQ